MSFDANPYVEMTVVSLGNGLVGWLCPSCGGGHRERYPEDITVEHLRAAWETHVRNSHQLTREDVADWGGGY